MRWAAFHHRSFLEACGVVLDDEAVRRQLPQVVAGDAARLPDHRREAAGRGGPVHPEQAEEAHPQRVGEAAQRLGVEPDAGDGVRGHALTVHRKELFAKSSLRSCGPRARLASTHDPQRGVLRPRQDDHRQVELAGLRQAVPGRGPDHPRRDAAAAYAQFVYLVGGADHDQMETDARATCPQLVRGLGRRDGQGDRRRDAARRRRPDRLRRGRHADGGAPRGRPRRRHRHPPAAPRSSSRSARCSAPTT